MMKVPGAYVSMIGFVSEIAGMNHMDLTTQEQLCGFRGSVVVWSQKCHSGLTQLPSQHGCLYYRSALKDYWFSQLSHIREH